MLALVSESDDGEASRLERAATMDDFIGRFSCFPKDDKNKYYTIHLYLLTTCEEVIYYP